MEQMACYDPISPTVTFVFVSPSSLSWRPVAYSHRVTWTLK
ncbi:hypothetical protein Chelonae_p3628 [[Mycobacterium] chelonae subsp. bovistauri]|nr:hypothetical protein Chelonae_p3628 [Mycobacterium sp. QIA-37]